MKIEMELKDAPKFQRIETIKVNQDIHDRATLNTLVRAVRKTRSWVKIVDIRIDMR